LVALLDRSIQFEQNSRQRDERPAALFAFLGRAGGLEIRLELGPKQLERFGESIECSPTRAGGAARERCLRAEKEPLESEKSSTSLLASRYR
jgi:hypothetical protein